MTLDDDDYMGQPLSDEKRESLKQWWHWIYDADGNLIEDRVLAELSDFGHMLEEVPKVYVSITDGRMSKPSYFAADVLSQHENVLEDMMREVQEETLDNVLVLLGEDCAPENLKKEILGDG